MALSSRERMITIIVLAACAVFVIDRVAIEPYFDQRQSLKMQLKASQQKLDQADNIFNREKHLRQTLVELSGSIKSDPSSAEAQLLQVLHDWEQQSAVTNPSFQRIHAGEEHGYTNLTYHISASGNMAAVALLLYQIESAKIPLKVDDVQVSPRHDNGEELTIQVNVSTLSRPEKESPSSVAAAGGTR